MAAGEPGDPPGQPLPGIGDEIGGLMCAWGGDGGPLGPGEDRQGPGSGYLPLGWQGRLSPPSRGSQFKLTNRPSSGYSK